MMTLNAIAIRRVAQKLGAVLQQKPSVTVMLFNFKLVILIGLVFCALRYLHVEPIPFIVGISVLPFAIMIVAVQVEPRPRRRPRGVQWVRRPPGSTSFRE